MTTLLAVTMAGTPVALRAQTATNGPAYPPPYQSHGPCHTLFAASFVIDNSAKTITVGTLTLQITSETIITKMAKPATLADGVEGDVVGGAYRKDADGKLNAVSLRFGPKPPPPETGEMKTNKSIKPLKIRQP